MLNETFSVIFKHRALFILLFLQMLDVMTCSILSIATIFSMVIMAVGSFNRINKFQLKSNPKIVLAKVPDLHQYRPFWAHRAFQMRRCSQVNVDMTLKSFENKENKRKSSIISIGKKETTV